ncbi:MAG TPA: diaminobutyrate acetyltransferase [Eoetvoesiella sp.]
MAVDADQQQSQITVLRRPFKADAPAVHRLVTECPPLDLNSLYTYLLLSEHFSDTCVVAEHDGILDGYLSAYIPPAKPDVLFVWQVAVHSRARGRGLGRSMLSSLLERPGLRQVRYIETTVGSNNAASRGMFAGFARMLRADCRESPLFEQQLFGPSGHDDEPLIRIGPFEVLHK